jgi:hypothetical protein
MTKSGRPLESEGDQATKQVRIFKDLADMLSDLALVHPKVTAQILDPLIRAEVTELHALYLPKITEAKRVQKENEERLQKVRDEAAKLTEQPVKKSKRG